MEEDDCVHVCDQGILVWWKRFDCVHVCDHGILVWWRKDDHVHVCDQGISVWWRRDDCVQVVRVFSWAVRNEEELAGVFGHAYSLHQCED